MWVMRKDLSCQWSIFFNARVVLTDISVPTQCTNENFNVQTCGFSFTLLFPLTLQAHADTSQVGSSTILHCSNEKGTN